jgi:Holliday junction resolvase-like predicted endonuclease
VTNYAAGHAAEKRAAEHLITRGYEIIELNWKTRWCETDIIAEKAGVVYFVEVKYRRSAEQGRGLDYITPGKIEKMALAAELWVSQRDWPGDYALAAIGLDGREVEFVILT